MATPSDIQMRQTRDALQAMAEKFKKLKQEKGDELSYEEIKAINEAIRTSLDAASGANADAIQDTADNIQMCVSRIDAAKNDLDAALKNMGKVKKVVSIAATVVALASAVAIGDAESIIIAAGDVIDEAKV